VVVADIPIDVLTDDAPVYDRPCAAPADASTTVDPAGIPIPGDLTREVLDLVGSPNVGSRAWVWRQYDQIVRGGTIVRPGSDAAVVRVPCEKDGKTVEKLLAFAVDCNGRMCELDPYVGGAMAIAEVCRNLACSGAEPIGITDCLNFGNPERPDVMDQFARSIDGIAAACKALGVPIVSGNVSLYNETDGRSILPTPTVAAVGLVASREDVVTACFKGAGDVVLLLGQAPTHGARALGGSEWLVQKIGKLAGEAPLIELAAEAKLQKLLVELARAHVLQSAHDVSDGGLAAALAECCTTGPEDVGARVELPAGASATEALAALFGEAPSRVVVSAAKADVDRVLAAAAAAGVPAARLGETGGDALAVAAAPLGSFSVAVAEVRARREACLRGIVGEG
jgi:phosphoribosylformylglycinamidine synthase subunit PurL